MSCNYFVICNNTNCIENEVYFNKLSDIPIDMIDDVLKQKCIVSDCINKIDNKTNIGNNKNNNEQNNNGKFNEYI